MLVIMEDEETMGEEEIMEAEVTMGVVVITE